MITYFDEDGSGPHEHECETGPEAVRDWATRALALGRIDKKQAELFEQCAEDLEVGGG